MANGIGHSGKWNAPALVGDYAEDGTPDLIVSSNQALYIYKAIVVQPEPGTIRLEAADYAVSEDGAEVRVKVIREGGSHGAVAVTYHTADGSAKADKHYKPTSGTLSFADGELEKWIEIEILNDDIHEDDREFYLNIAAVPGTVVGSPIQAVITITEDDPQPDTEGPLWPAAASCLHPTYPPTPSSCLGLKPRTMTRLRNIAFLMGMMPRRQQR